MGTVRRPHGGHSGEENDLSISINPLGPPNSFQEGSSNQQTRSYPDRERRQFRKTVASRLEIPFQNILPTAGSGESISLLVSQFSDSDILVTTPTFTEFEDMFKAVARVQTHWFWRKEPSLEGLIESLRLKEPDVCILCNPNNPTGQLLAQDQIKKIIRTARKLNTIVVLDEAYMSLSLEPHQTSIPLVDQYDNLVVLRSLTKFFGIPGRRIGYLVASSRLIESLRLRQNPWPCERGTLVQARQALENKQFRSQTRDWLNHNYEYVMTTLTSLGNVELYPSKCHLFLIKARVKNIGKKLAKKGFCIRDASTFTNIDKDWIRFSLRRESTNREFLEALKKTVSPSTCFSA
ncbi:MAG: histidinol-phosphate transaminase [bacterium]